MTKKNWLTFIDSIQHDNELITQGQVPIGYGIYHIREIGIEPTPFRDYRFTVCCN